VRVTSLYIPNPQLTPTSTATGDLSGSISPTNNQIIMQGFGYDLAGNLTADPSPASMVYDAENRQTSYTKSGTTGYGYDGDGHRVTKTAGGATTVFVYNIAGQLIAEYGGSATNSGTSYLTTDSLGSTRVVTDGNKAVIARHDYLPFGEEIPSGIGNRPPGLGYVTTDDTRQKFTSKERDNESSLDYFGARYYSGAQGRFTGCDPENYQARGELADPQSWNAYGYVNNNPLRRVDPEGKGFFEKLKNSFLGYGFITDEEKNRRLDAARTHLQALETKFGGLYTQSNLTGQVTRIDVGKLQGHDLLDWDKNFTERGADNYSLDPDEAKQGIVYIQKRGG
jgi:RHS repeat-associated protein